MLANPAPFPHPGAAAIYRGQPVRVVQHNRDSTVLVTGAGVRAHVALADLVDAATRTAPIDRWLTVRSDPRRRPDEATPVHILHEDFRQWARAEHLEAQSAIQADAFDTALIDRGFPALTMPAREYGGDVATMVRAFAILLKPAFVG